jgi:hypothetical protein
MARRAIGTTVMLRMLIGLCLLATLGCTAQMVKPVAHINMLHPGLEQVKAPSFDVVFLRTGVEFGAYKKYFWMPRNWRLKCLTAPSMNSH